MSRRLSRHTVVIAFLSAWIVGSASVHASDIPAGSDLLTSVPGNGDHTHTMEAGTWFDFGPGIGIVDLEGLPIGPGTTDTIVERLEGAIFPFKGTNLWPGTPTPGTDVRPAVLAGLSTEQCGLPATNRPCRRDPSVNQNTKHRCTIPISRYSILF